MKVTVTFGFLRNHAIHLAAALVLLCVPGIAPATQEETHLREGHEAADDKGQSEETARQEEIDRLSQEIEELGVTLKAAVMSGSMTEDEAGEIYKAVVTSIKTEWDDTHAGEAKEAEAKEGYEASPKRRIMMLSVPKLGQIRMLFQPQFLNRDLPGLRDELDLDRTQVTITQALFGDYLEGFELASSPLLEAMKRYRRTTRDQWIANVLERSDQSLGAASDRVRRLDPDDAVEGMKLTLERIGQENLEESDEREREEFRAWQERMVEVTADLDGRLASLRERVGVQLARMDQEDATINADDLVRMAKQLRSEREQLHSNVTLALEAITNEEQRGEDNVFIESALARIRIARLLPQGRLGGESMNLWAAMTETRLGLEPRGVQTELLGYAEAMLQERASGIADMLDARMEATLDREIEGLEFQAVREEIATANGESVFEVETRRLADAKQPFATANRRELTASIAVRDALGALLAESSMYIDELYPDTEFSKTYREASLRRGFPMEMRRRWSERSISAALQLDDLDDETHGALLAIEVENDAKLAALRRDAIATCIIRDPKLARDFIDAELKGDKSELEWSPDMWLGINYEAFASIDDRTESQLRAILLTEQFEMLPALKRAEEPKAMEGRKR